MVIFQGHVKLPEFLEDGGPVEDGEGEHGDAFSAPPLSPTASEPTWCCNLGMHSWQNEARGANSLAISSGRDHSMRLPEVDMVSIGSG